MKLKMRTPLLVPVVAALICVPSLVGIIEAAEDAESLVLAVPLDGIVVQDDGTGTAEFSGGATTGQAGRPALPVVHLRLLLPPDVDLGTVASSLVDKTVESVPGSWAVRPLPPLMTLSGSAPIWPEGAEIVDGRDVTVYSTDALQPASHLTRFVTMKLREWRIAAVDISPFRYNPVSRELVQLKQAKLRITFERHAKFTTIRTRSAIMARQVRQDVRAMVANFDEIASEYDERP